MYMIQGWPDCLEVGRRKSKDICPYCGRASMVWYWTYREEDGIWTSKEVASKAEAYTAAKAYAATKHGGRRRPEEVLPAVTEEVTP